MTIKEVSEAYGITADTLRYYERIGMLPPVTRTGGGIRDYTEEDRAWLELVLCMRSAGLAIEAITQYVRLYRERDDAGQTGAAESAAGRAVGAKGQDRVRADQIRLQDLPLRNGGGDRGAVVGKGQLRGHGGSKRKRMK